MGFCGSPVGRCTNTSDSRNNFSILILFILPRKLHSLSSESLKTPSKYPECEGKVLVNVPSCIISEVLHSWSFFVFCGADKDLQKVLEPRRTTSLGKGWRRTTTPPPIQLQVTSVAPPPGTGAALCDQHLFIRKEKNHKIIEFRPKT